ncbi:MAG: hypothetical protein AAFQ62_10595 [Pseudomonadota bacterium]
MLRSLVMVVSLAGLQTAFAQQQQCAQVLGSVYDSAVFESSTYFENHAASYLCRDDSQSFQGSQAGRLGVDLAGIIKASGADLSGMKIDKRSALCAAARNDTYFSQDIFAAARSVNEKVIEAWKECISYSGPGLHFWVEIQENDPMDLVFRAKYIPISRDLVVVETTVDVPPNFLRTRAGGDCEFPQTVGPEGWNVVCRRTDDGKKPFTVSMKSKLGDVTFEIARVAPLYEVVEWESPVFECTSASVECNQVTRRLTCAEGVSKPIKQKQECWLLPSTLEAQVITPRNPGGSISIARADRYSVQALVYHVKAKIQGRVLGKAVIVTPR